MMKHQLSHAEGVVRQYCRLTNQVYEGNGMYKGQCTALCVSGHLPCVSAQESRLGHMTVSPVALQR